LPNAQSQAAIESLKLTSSRGRCAQRRQHIVNAQATPIPLLASHAAAVRALG
jgi:hypothetical protein